MSGGRVRVKTLATLAFVAAIVFAVSSGTPARRGFWDRVSAGARGTEAVAMPVPAGLAASARALLEATPVDVTPLPADALAIDVHVSGAYLDAKNRAAGLLDGDGVAESFAELSSVWEESREGSVEPIAPADVDAFEYYGVRILDALLNRDGSGLQDDVPGAERLLEEVRAVLDGAGPPSVDVRELKLWSHTARAAVWGPGSEDVLLATRAAVEAVLDTPVPQEGPFAGAVLAWADDSAAPEEARVLAQFESEPTADVSTEATSLPGDLVTRVLARHGSDETPPTLGWTSGSESHAVAPEDWIALAAPDGRVFWLAGTAGAVALTDGSLRGWAFSGERVWLVDATDAGRILAAYDLE